VSKFYAVKNLILS